MQNNTLNLPFVIIVLEEITNLLQSHYMILIITLLYFIIHQIKINYLVKK